MDDFIKAGKITSKAREYAKSLIKEGVNIYEFVNKIETKIYNQGAKLAFPVNISINENAAHDTCDYKSEAVFEKGQLVKVDLGAQVNGFVGDTAFTVEIGTSKYSDLIKASQDALKSAINIIKPGIMVKEIGKVIYETITNAGFNPIYNLGGHGVGRYDLHHELFIPNYDNGDSKKLKDGDKIAIEPFATTGEGRVSNTNTVKIFAMTHPRPSRIMTARLIQSFIKKEFNTLPFAEHHLLKKFKPVQVRLGLKQLIMNDSIHQYPILREVSNGMVSQAEHTILVKDKPIITTL